MPNTIGIVVVAALAARADGVLPGVAITVTRRCTRSVANSDSRALSPLGLGAASFDQPEAEFDRHLVGGREQLVGHGHAEHSGGLSSRLLLWNERLSRRPESGFELSPRHP